MEKSQKISRRVLLVIGVIVGLMIFLLGSQLNANFAQSSKSSIKVEPKTETHSIVKKFFS